MRLRIAIAACALSMSPAALVQAGPDIVPARLGQARYVILGYDVGDRVITELEAASHPEILREDREALRVLRNALEDWKRYVVVDKPGTRS